ncbi:MAG: prefoldin subunit [Candidatus Woesearchaeota archaeon]|jgi:prefoldin beta subunit|nr:prefoldin subunit [Candidatus Woesearchaeota archaeon]MDP7198911.1 prefoldin subunit [Candidatus Woesearchaeota archaeon]MDP7467290.1 prefoldin subunit [Candidatus Woesearchaeota archaeon]MDP7647906.1 prefoldin subunit [Candidatus Woesearchaeota archaeon]|tara:strand:+ start:425 stop:751 length:327 start_codon:yes stop_codon:yes gene_type:complete
MSKKEMQEKFGQLQAMEQNVQQLTQQKQQLQSSFFELESAEKELKTAKTAFRIVGNLMVQSNKDELAKDVTSKKEILELKINTLEKQEKKLREESQTLQQALMKDMGK